MRRLATLGLVIGLMTALTAAPALADKPVQDTVTVTFEDMLNPCDAPNTHDVTITFDAKIHEHRNNLLFVVEGALTTDSGFEGKGHETSVFTENAVAQTFNYVATNQETGEKLRMSAHITFSNGELRVLRDGAECIRDV